MQHEGEGPCGDVKIEKAECINLVPEIRNNTQKRKTTNGIKRKQRQVRRMKEIGGKGKLTDFATGKLELLYHRSLTKKGICASFLHCSSSDENPQRQLCSNTSDSWCFYQKALANNRQPPSHNKMKIQFILPSELRQSAGRV